MNSFSLHFSERALSELEKLDKPISHRVLKRIRWLADHFDSLKPQPLAGEFAGLFKLRIGDYRVIYEIDRGRQPLWFT